MNQKQREEKEADIRRRLNQGVEWYTTVGAYDIADLLRMNETLRAERDEAVNKLRGWETAPTWVAVPVLKKQAEQAERWAKRWKAAARLWMDRAAMCKSEKNRQMVLREGLLRRCLEAIGSPEGMREELMIDIAKTLAQGEK